MSRRSTLSVAVAQARTRDMDSVAPHQRRLYERGRRLDAYLSDTMENDSIDSSVDSHERAGLLHTHALAQPGRRRRLVTCRRAKADREAV